MGVIACDLGGSGGKIFIGVLKSRRLELQEIHRFSNDPVRIGNHLYWDILRLFHEVKQGLVTAKLANVPQPRSLGIDTWGLDFGLLNKDGELIGNPYHYRDKQSNGMIQEVCSLMSQKEIYNKTGIQFTPVNTLYHLYALQKRNSPFLEQAETLLMIPDLLRYFLTGEKNVEETIASTSQLLHAETGQWDDSLIEQLALPRAIFPNIVKPGTITGRLRPSVCSELGVSSVKVIAVGEHDTASAVAAVPSNEENMAYLSCGTWSLLGTETEHPVINSRALAWNFTNEKGIAQTNRLLKNIMGLWLVQECKRAWQLEGHLLSHEDLISAAEEAVPFYCFIDPDDHMFLNPAHMPKQIQEYCKQTNQPVPETKGQIIRCVLESLAFTYRLTLERIESLTNKLYPGLHIVGGGAKNQLLCQFTANAIGKPVWAGPYEATAIGNALVQYMAFGEIGSLREARQIVKQSFEIRSYEPREAELWERKYEVFRKAVHHGLQKELYNR